MVCSRNRHSSLQAFVPAGRGPRANEKVCGSDVCEQWRSSFKPDIPGPAGLWHFPEKVPREGKENTLPTHPPTYPPGLLRFLLPLALGLGLSSDPLPWARSVGGAPSHPPRLWRGSLESTGVVGGASGRRGVSSPAPVGIAICSKFGVGSRGGGELASSQLSPLTPNQTSPAVSWVGMVRGSVRPEAAAVPAARALSCAREQTPEQRAVLGSEAVVNHLGCNANEAWPGAWS